MTTILQINSAARSQGAQSTLLATELAQKLARPASSDAPAARIIVRDLLAENLPHLDDAILGAFFTPAGARDAAQEAIIARSDALIAELQAADIVVIGAPLYNFGVSSQLKSYFDWIARAGVTFRYTEKGPQGLVTGKQVYVAAARGGLYQGTPNDTQTPFLKAFLGFLGMTEVTFIYAEGIAMGADKAALALSDARQAIAAL